MSASARVAIVILVLLLLPVVFGPIVIGLLLERGAEQLIDANGASGVQITFDRGLYTSRARTSFAIEDGEGRGGELVAEHVIVHGPIPLAAPAIGRSPFDLVIVLVRSELAPDPDTMPGVAEALGGQPLASVFTRVTSVGDIDAEIEAPPFELDGGRLIWAGLEGRVTLRDTGRMLAGDLATEGLRIADDQASLTLEPGSTAFEADMEARRLTATLEQSGSEWVFGDRRFSSGQLRIEADQPIGGDLLGDASSVWTIDRLSGVGGLGEDEFEMAGLRIEQSVALDPDSGLHRGELGLAFESWRVGAAPADGPGGFRAHIERIDRAAVERFRAAMQKLEQSGRSPDEIEAMRPFVVMEQLPDLLASSPALEVRDGFVESPEGRLDASMHLTVDGSQPELLGDPFMLMSLIAARAKMEGPEPLVRRLVDRLLPEVQTAPPVVAEVPRGVIVSDPDAPAPGEAPAAGLGEAPVAGSGGAPAAGSGGAPAAGSGGAPAAAPGVPPAAGFGEETVPVDRVDAWLQSGTLVREGERLHFDARFENGMPMLNGRPADPELITNLMPGL